MDPKQCFFAHLRGAISKCHCYAMPCYAMICYALLCYDSLCYAMLCHAMLCYATVCNAMLRYAMICYVLLCYAMLCYAWLCWLCWERWFARTTCAKEGGPSYLSLAARTHNLGQVVRANHLSRFRVSKRNACRALCWTPERAPSECLKHCLGPTSLYRHEGLPRLYIQPLCAVCCGVRVGVLLQLSYG